MCASGRCAYFNEAELFAYCRVGSAVIPEGDLVGFDGNLEIIVLKNGGVKDVGYGPRT